MYAPHLMECKECLTPFVDGQVVYHWFEDYICDQCVPQFIFELGSHIWHPPPHGPVPSWNQSEVP